MASSPPPLLLLLLLLAAAISSHFSTAAAFRLDFHHRFSAPVRRWAEKHGHPGAWWPEKEGTAGYYAALAHHDRALHRRFLAGSNSSSDLITFSDGNETTMFSSLGFLHYAFVELGTPRKRFLVALDTGSDLFWVPCDCVQCAPTTSPRYGKLKLNIYNPRQSSTSKAVPCTSGLCDLSSQCSGSNSSCPYNVQYLSVNTSSSGTLVEDILHLIRETATPEVIEASIVFGCGRVQTGAFLDSGAPNGLFGLGLEKIAVPSILASKGIASNSFSMCFGGDGSGRINFGDKGSLDQYETPFIVDKRHPFYFINLTGSIVGNESLSSGFNALVDSGTSFTLLADPIYTELCNSFTAQVQEKQLKPTPSNLPFDYCYNLLPNQETLDLPQVSFVTKSGSLFNITNPIIVLVDQKGNLVAYCLAIIKSSISNLHIIGHNFMIGKRVVFDRERSIIGWKNFNCSDIESSSNQMPPSPPAADAPAPNGASNKTKDASAPSPSGVSSHQNAMARFFLMLFLLAVVL